MLISIYVADYNNDPSDSSNNAMPLMPSGSGTKSSPSKNDVSFSGENRAILQPGTVRRSSFSKYLTILRFIKL